MNFIIFTLSIRNPLNGRSYMFWKILKYLSDFSNQNEKARDLRNLSVYKKTKLFWLKSKKKKNRGCWRRRKGRKRRKKRSHWDDTKLRTVGNKANVKNAKIWRNFNSNWVDVMLLCYKFLCSLPISSEKSAKIKCLMGGVFWWGR